MLTRLPRGLCPPLIGAYRNVGASLESPVRTRRDRHNLKDSPWMRELRSSRQGNLDREPPDFRQPSETR